MKLDHRRYVDEHQIHQTIAKSLNESVKGRKRDKLVSCSFPPRQQQECNRIEESGPPKSSSTIYGQ